MDIDRMRQYAASERHDEALEDLVGAAAEALDWWEQYRRGLLTADEFLGLNGPKMAALGALLEELTEEEE